MHKSQIPETSPERFRALLKEPDPVEGNVVRPIGDAAAEPEIRQ